MTVRHGAWSYHQGMLIRGVTRSLSRFPAAQLRRFALSVIAIASICVGLAILFHPGWGLIALGAGCLWLDAANDDGDTP
jgi:hypothetical protein